MGKFFRVAESNAYVLSLKKDIAALKELLKSCKHQWKLIQSLDNGSNSLKKNREEIENSINPIKYAINDLSKALRAHLQLIEHRYNEVEKFRESWKHKIPNYDPKPLRKEPDSSSYGPMEKALEEAFKQ